VERVQAPVDVRVAAPVAAPVEAGSPSPAVSIAGSPRTAEAAPETLPPVRASTATERAPEARPELPPVRAAVVATEPDPARDRLAAEGDGYRSTCTQAQLRRFIKSRPWVPMHELRRRFGIYGGDDDVSPIRVGDRTLFIGLPLAEGRMVGDLLSAADVGCELSLDPEAPVIVGVYPMRPVPRS